MNNLRYAAPGIKVDRRDDQGCSKIGGSAVLTSRDLSFSNISRWTSHREDRKMGIRAYIKAHDIASYIYNDPHTNIFTHYRHSSSSTTMLFSPSNTLLLSAPSDSSPSPQSLTPITPSRPGPSGLFIISSITSLKLVTSPWISQPKNRFVISSASCNSCTSSAVRVASIILVTSNLDINSLMVDHWFSVYYFTFITKRRLEGRNHDSV
jgi:hypothetical protein